MSIFSDVKTLPHSELAIRHMTYAKDTHPRKENLVVGGKKSQDVT